MQREDEWEITQTAAVNTAVTATKAAVAGKRHTITGLYASYDGAAVGQVDWKRGTSVVGSHYVQNADILQLSFRGDLGAAVEVSLAAVATRIGRVTITGYTEG